MESGLGFESVTQLANKGERPSFKESMIWTAGKELLLPLLLTKFFSNRDIMSRDDSETEWKASESVLS